MPEGDTVHRQAALLRRALAGKVLLRSDLRFPAIATADLSGRSVTEVVPRGKHLLIRTDGGPEGLVPLTLHSHLLMEGMWHVYPRGARWRRPGYQARAVLENAAAQAVGFDLGMLDLVPTAEEDGHRLLAGLGPEPLDDGFTAERLSASLAGRRTPVKAALLDQRVVAGLGNIYVCEALFRAGVAPDRLAADVAGEPAARLVPQIKATLHEAIAAGGSSLRDYVQPDGELGLFQHAWKVYGREGQPCERCPGPPDCPGVARRVQAGRSTFYCPRTQR